MNIKLFGYYISKSKPQDTTEQLAGELPITGGRSSISEGLQSLSSLKSALGVTESGIDPHLYDVLYHLSKTNADVSRAVNNIVTLGNTDHTIEFSDSVNDAEKKKMLEHIKRVKDTWYEYSSGMHSLINDLLYQCTVTGVVSGEFVPANDLSGVSGVVLVNPKNIRFVYDKETSLYIPKQQVNSIVEAGSTADNLVTLNPITYKYISTTKSGESPYGVPPFLSALDNIVIEKSMMDSMIPLIQRLGAFGFLQVLMTAPRRQAGVDIDGQPLETEKEYQSKIQSMFDTYSKEVDKGLKSGYVLGIKDKQSFDMKNTLVNVEGVKGLFDLNNEMKMSGLKQDPLMLGRNYSTTETIGRVLLTKLSSSIHNYQKTVGQFLSQCYLLELRLAGFNVDSLQVIFKQPSLSEEMKDEQTFTLKIANYDNLYKQGVISQTQRSQALGWESPDQEEPRAMATIAPVEVKDKDGDKKKTDPSYEPPEKSKTKSKNEKFDSHICDHERYNKTVDNFAEFKLGDKISSKIFREYTKNSSANYRKAVDKMVEIIASEVGKMPTSSSASRVTKKIIYSLLANWGVVFSEAQVQIINKSVVNAYTAFRADLSVFKKPNPNAKKNPVFNLTDYRTMDYYKSSDDHYMGKFVTDKAARKKMFNWVKKKHVSGTLPLGKNKDTLKSFRKQFGDLMVGEEHKMYRIVATTVNKLKSTANVVTMHEAGVKSFQIQGLSDDLQCPYCAGLQGKTFSVKVWKDRIDEQMQMNPTDEFVAPFITNVYDTADDIAATPSAALERQGLGMPPFHPFCRDRVVAV